MRRIVSGEPCALAIEDRIGCNNRSVRRRNEEYPTASVQVSESANGKCRPLFACTRNAPLRVDSPGYFRLAPRPTFPK
jgi:hypothetical protein